MTDYADRATVKVMLGITGTAEDARLDLLNAVVSRQLEVKAGLATGGAFGTASTAVARTFLPGNWTDTLVLAPPIRSVTTVVEDGVTLVANTDYRLIYRVGDFYGALYRIGDPAGWAAINRDYAYPLAWGDSVVVTGQWADQATSPLAVDIVEAANVLVAGYYRKDHTADGEVSGPEGFQFRPGDPWNDPRVKLFIERYTSWQ